MNKTNHVGYVPLYYAAKEGHHKVAELLLSQVGIQVNISNHSGVTPLLAAACNGHERVVELLLGHEDIQVKRASKSGCTPLNMAAQNGHDKVVDLLLPRAELTVPLNQNSTCIVCLDRLVDVVLVPCGHQNLCGPCAHQWSIIGKGCPMDRIQIYKILPLNDN